MKTYSLKDKDLILMVTKLLRAQNNIKLILLKG